MNKISMFLMSMPLLLMAACSQGADDLIEKNETIGQCDSTNPLIRYINIKNGETRSNETVSISPYIYENDTVMYVAQHTAGWELYSNDRRFPMILMKSEDGTFNVSEFSSPVKAEIMDMAAAIHQTKIEDPDLPTDESWSWLNPQFEEDGDIAAMANTETPDLNNGHWVLLEIIDKGTTVYDVPHLTQTKWGQLNPWNTYIPYDRNKPDKHSAVGCVVVAAAQYAYFLHYKIGYPVWSPSFGSYLSIKNQYSFQGLSSTGLWDSMAKKSFQSGTNQTALFMGFVAGRIVDSDKFSADGTHASLKQAIERYLRPQTGLEFEELSFDDKDYGKILSEINSGYPVIAKGNRTIMTDGTESSVGHAFLIDSYRKETKTTEYVYGWDGKTVSGRDPNIYNRDGTIAEYGIKRTTSQSQAYYYFRMNWGADGTDDDILSSPYSWKKGSLTPYSSKRSIILRK